ncbi:MAG TPA: MmcQ/YjbR family DNA-binding protein [Bryobacteraceae bacterium]|nr:MmcQ/YjbR family DNA-binding protein [Bryobacteraceae bacterium]
MAARVSFETVRKMGLLLPGVEDCTTYGQPALKAGGKMLVCLPSHKSAEPDSLVVRIDFEQRAELLAAAPDTYYITPHYEDYPAVLVRLSRITPDVLGDLLGMAHRFVLRQGARRAPGNERVSKQRRSKPAGTAQRD